MDQAAGNKKMVAVVGLLLIVAAIGVGVAATSKPKSAPAVASSASPSPTATTTPGVSPAAVSSSTPTVASAGTVGYRDGTYAATGTYISPGGTESIQISLTLKDGVVADTSAVSGSTNPTGQQFQGRFIGGYKAQVVGKNLEDLQLSKVSGSSLTPKGFNNALVQIKAQAKG